MSFVYDGGIVMDPHISPSVQTTETSKEDRTKINSIAAKAWARNGQQSAWKTLLRPLTCTNPLPVEVSVYLIRHFDPNPLHKPSKLAKFHGIEVEDHQRHRDTTRCFFCAALCDRITRKSLELPSRRVLRSTPVT